MSKETEIKIISRLQILAKKLNKTPTRREYLAEYGNPEFKNYGGYNTMLIKAGLKVNIHVNLTDEEIKKMYIDYIKSNGVPKSYEIPKSLPSCNMIQDRFGSYKKFLKSIGYNSYQKNYTKEQVIKILQEGIDNGDIKSMIDLNKPNFPTPAYLYKTFKVNSWKEILKIINRKLDSNFISHENYKFSKEELKSKYIQLSEKLNKTKTGASKNDVRKYLGFSEQVFFTCFKKTLNELRKDWGYIPRESRKIYTKEIIISALDEQEKKLGRKLILREIESCKELPTINTIYKAFKTTSLKKIYEEINDIKSKKC